MNTQFDAIIIGAGPAGTATAIALARQGRSVAIIERSEFPRRKVCGEFTSATNVDLLDRLGVGAQFRNQAGPEVRRVALFASGHPVEAPMPKGQGATFGRALGRDILDELLLDAAIAAGVSVFQPWRATGLVRGKERSVVAIESGAAKGQLDAPVIVAAHGSWEPGKLSTNLAKINRPHDFLGFKAHFLGGRLASDLMPLIAFPGGYGGMVWADHDRLSLSFCMRRDALALARQASPNISAAEATYNHILRSCPGVAEALHGAELAGPWLAAGPIRPGIRAAYDNDVFRVGNIAGESHPIIAEGIAMALQSGWILAAQLERHEHWGISARTAAGKSYGAAWRNQFEMRIQLAAILSSVAASSSGAKLMQAVIGRFPASLSFGAALSGKTKRVPALG
ncbi:NAD(P)/FAD-dependent oxidoreductase [Devosia psychrophila]|uniref:Dehydrogenase (Flavoprotein) n=1 Tax=Devosia psychrophila TaxID=728005 RepID=A0A0F5PW16_9HYPH|nr:NAD(P)/FAD-dependent oxidoreductase [Devosia psychrophila]KKC32887.1 monooxygenase [Devosia psychrophila]SFD17165.1 Dehydrogenase (flavoprotein) [Devosia psychrophila]